MKKTFLFLFAALFVLSLGSNVFAQDHEMYLPEPTEPTYINQIVMGDTLADGSRADIDRVYVLQRGGMWFFNGVIKNIDWAVRIKAEEGDGPKPIIYGQVEEGGANVPIDFIDAQGDVYLTNVVVNGIFDLDEEYKSFTYGAPKELIVFGVAGDYTLTVDGCIFENAYQADLRTFAGIRSINVTNCIFANSGCSPWQSVSNGRAVDIRNVSCDTLLMVNNTFVNGNDRVVRHIGSTARLNNFIFEHNTVVNNGGRYGFMALGLIGDKVQIRNNLLVDPMGFGADTSLNRQSDFIECGETFSETIVSRVNMALIYSQLEETPYATDFDMQNNYYCNTQDMLDTWEQLRTETGKATLKAPSPLTRFLESQVDLAKAFIDLDPDFTFTEAPAPMTGMVYWNISLPPFGADENSKGGDGFTDYDRRTTIYHRDTLDCTYATSSPAYTGALGGYPAGDLNWFPDKKAAWEAAGGWTDIEHVSDVPTDFSLSQNYPNPFNPTTKISYSLPGASKVKLQIYDVLGRVVATLVNTQQAAGSYSVDFNAASLASGVYVYQLSTSDFTVSKKMMLMK